MPRPVPAAAIATVRSFNRFYTRRIGVLRASLLGSGFSLTEVRVLHQIRHQAQATASEIAAGLDLDTGYLSRMLQRFTRAGLITRTPGSDRRHAHLALTGSGRTTVARLERKADDEVAELLQPLSPMQRSALLGAMASIETVLMGPAAATGPVRLRHPVPGDLGWLVHRHGVLYASEYGWDRPGDHRFEGLVAEVVADFARKHDPQRERCWIAERQGAILGCVLLVRHPTRKRTAKLRILLVEPGARGLGLGRQLVAACTRFARKAGYRTITLWTNTVLQAARKLYVDAGYRLVEEKAHQDFGSGLVGQSWDLEL